jgi:hypothetical protein
MKEIVEKETKLKDMEEVWDALLRMEHQFDRKFPGFSDIRADRKRVEMKRLHC